MQALGARRPLPLPLRGGRIGAALVFRKLLDGVNQRIRIPSRGYQHLQLVPQPLPRSREVEVMPFNRKAVDESDLAPGWMSGVSPVAGFHEYRTQKADLDDFADDAIDLNPVADLQAIAPHQHEPSEEADDEVLERDGQARACKPENGCRVVGDAEHNADDEQRCNRLQREPYGGTQPGPPFLLQRASRRKGGPGCVPP